MMELEISDILYLHVAEFVNLKSQYNRILNNRQKDSFEYNIFVLKI